MKLKTKIKFYFIFLQVLLQLTSCYSQTISTNTKSNNTLDSNRIAIIKYDSTFNDVFKDCKSTPLSLDEIKLVEKLVIEGVRNYNTEGEKIYKAYNERNKGHELSKKAFIIDLKRKYKQQYVAIINKAGEKEVWVNCLCMDGLSKKESVKLDWRNHIISAEGGGACYFNLKTNLTLNKYYALYVNDIE